VAIGDLPLFSTLRERLSWHEARQRVLAENVANADTPGFRARDLAPFQPAAARSAPMAPGLARTNPQHLGPSARDAAPDPNRRGPFEIRPQGNAVTLEEEMMKVAQNQMDHQAAVTLYQRSVGLIKTALGRRA
jgi:flagellar basal-body rod protein FlgB